MRIELDLTQFPANVRLLEAGDFSRFHVVARGDHTFVPIDRLQALAGELADDPAWKSQLAGMVEYARSKGWVNDAGAIRAHIETEP